MLSKKLTNKFSSIIHLQFLFLILSFYIWGWLCFKKFGLCTMSLFFLLLLFAKIPYFYVSVLYPYAGHFFALSYGFYFLVLGLENHKNNHFIFFGICLALAIYERGALLLLPAFICVSLLLFKRPLKFKINKYFFIGVLISYILITPWLIRNAKLNAYGMNQMFGYSLGLTYGDLKSKMRNDFMQKYDLFIKKFGTDRGTQLFISYNVLTGNGTFQENDRRVAKLIYEKMKDNKGKVINVIKTNLLNFPSRLINFNLPRFPYKTPGNIYSRYVRASKPGILDYIILILSISAILHGIYKKDIFYFLTAGFLFYFLLFSTTIVIFDPRYRSIIDMLVYITSIDFLKRLSIRASIIKNLGFLKTKRI